MNARRADIYYHVTPRKNKTYILENGLIAETAVGEMQVVWLCDHPQVMRTFAHVATQKKTWNLVVFPVFYQTPEIFHLHKMYYSGDDIPPDALGFPDEVIWKQIKSPAVRKRIQKKALTHEWGNTCPFCDSPGACFSWGKFDNILFSYCGQCKRYNQPELTLLED